MKRLKMMIWISAILGIMGCVNAIYDPASIGIKTKTYHRDPIISNVYEQNEQLSPPPPQQTATYHRTTTIERLSPVQSISSSSGSGGGSYDSSHNINEHQLYPQPSLPQLQLQPPQYQYQQQGNNHYQQQSNQQQHRHQYDQQQEIPLYQRGTPTSASSSTSTTKQTVNSNWNHGESPITEYYTDCPHGHTGQLPYVYDCRRFINCWHGRGQLQSCGAGTVFNPETLECDRPDKVMCGALGVLGEMSQQQQQHQQSNYQQQLQQSHQSSTANYRTGRLLDIRTEDIELLCAHGLNGLQPHPHNCSKFINCANGNVHVQECGPGTAFSIPMMVCDYKEKVDCGEREYTYGEGMLDVRMDENNGAAYKQENTKIACPPGESGLFPHPLDCTKFLNCANGITYIQDCGPGTAFDRVNKNCGFKKDHCGSTDGATVQNNWTNFQNSHDQTDSRKEYSGESDILCPGNVTGLFVHPFDYTKFVNCRNGNTAIQNCVSGTIFSISKGFCDLKENVQYIDRVSYIVSEVNYQYSKMLMSCPPETEGLHLYPYDCTKYIQCIADGHMWILKCPLNFVFSISKKKCLSKEQVSSYDRVKYFYELHQISTTTTSKDVTGVSSTLEKSHIISCPTGKNGVFPYPFDGIKYIICRDGQLSIETCASGTAFSLSKKQCLLRDTLAAHDVVLFRQEFAEEWSSEVGYSYGLTPGSLYIICPPKIDDGIFLHPFDCTKYIRCHKGSTSTENCSPSTVFSISKESCVNSDQVKDYDRVDFYIDTAQHERQDYSTYDNGTIVCPPNAIGLYPHPNDAQKYLRCNANERPIVENCLAGRVFSISKRYCGMEFEIAKSDRSDHGRNYEQKVSTTMLYESQLKSQTLCPPGANDMHPHPYDCTKYLNCVNGEATVQICGPGTAWSKEMEVCDFKNKVDCTGREPPIYNQWETNNKQVQISTTMNKISCPKDIGDGFYPHPFDYSRYFICQHGQSFVGRCTQGQVFSISRRICDNSESVIMTDHVTLITEFITEMDHTLDMNQNYGFVSCPSKISGFFVYPFDCTKFVKCDYGQTFIEICPSETVFSLSGRNCLSKSRVTRMDRVAFITETQNDLYYWKNNEANSLVLCPMGISGYFQHPYDWTKYLDCTNNAQIVVKVCPVGTVFSVSRGQCEMEINVSYDDRCHNDQRIGAYENGLEKQQTDLSSATWDSGSDLKCPTGVNGLYPHPYDCTKFLNCANGMTYIQSCGPGTAFNPSTKVCDLKHKVDCSQTGGGAHIAKISAPLTRGLTLQCPAGATGLLPHPYDCTKFLNCADGTTHVQACGPGTAWSRDMEVCDFISNVDCSNREISHYQTNRDSKSYGHTGATTTSTSSTYTDRWSNMNMARPDAKVYGHASSTADSSALWTNQQNGAGIYGSGAYGQSDYNKNRATVTTNTDTNWVAVGSSVDRQNPQENVLYMEGSLEPDRNYINTFHTYKAPLAPLSSNTATDLTSTTTTTTTTTGTKNIYYAQPVESEENLDKPYDHTGGGGSIRPAYPIPIPGPYRQNNSRNINHLSNSNSWTPIVRHENTLETHTVQLPNQEIVPPKYDEPTPSGSSSSSINIPNRHLNPPPLHTDHGQKPVSFGDTFSDNGQFEITAYDQTQSASDNRPEITALSGNLQPQPVSTKPNQHTYTRAIQQIPTPTSTKLTPVELYENSNLYGGLQPPNADPHPVSTATTTLTNASNVRIHQIYPPMQNATVIDSHGNPHYSSPYSGVAHSRNATWFSSPTNVNNPLDNSAATTTTTTTTQYSMPPSYNRQYYKNTVGSDREPPTEVATDLVDTDLPISDALRMLLRPYFNRSGTVNEDTAQKAESHIMRLVVDSEHTTNTPTPKPKSMPNFVANVGKPSVVTKFTDPSDQQDQQTPTEEDVELIIAGEQHSLANVSTRNSTEFHNNQENSKQPKNWYSHMNTHSREFHLRHPNLPNPFTTDSKNTALNQEKHPYPHSHSHSQPHRHNHHHSPHHHNREFHLRHPELPNPFPTREGDISIVQPDLLDIPNPNAEATTPVSHVNPVIRTSGTNDDCQYDCGNGKCVNQFQVCDGINNCGNRKDESKCDHLGYEVRLTGGESTHMGRIEVKIRGKWSYVCDDKFGLRDADVVCRELGFNLGASEVRGNSFYPPVEANFAFAMDEVECHGNETALKDCNFKGWGINNCGSDEVVGVVCKVPLFKCPNNLWLCSTSKECIPPAFLCDNTPDCADKSDESEQVCKAPIEYRLEGGRNANEGRLEVKYRGEWGTVCDDDFGFKEAQVVCNSLGYYGKPQIEKNIYGPGNGPIWLDQVSCWGNETSIDKCSHWTWGEHNCNHTEDVGIRCTAGPPPRHLLKLSPKDDEMDRQNPLDDAEVYQSGVERSSKFLRQQPNCGKFKANVIDEYDHPEERVINGSIAKRGRHPWQATIRTRGRGGISSHWCGAVLIGDGNLRQSSHLLTAAHCLAGYQKGAYFIRMGDHYANIAESSETDAFIENWYTHEKFRDQTHMNNDIALIVLKSPVRFNDYIQPVCLPEKGASLESDRQCTISGWGSIKSGISTPSNILRAAQIPILPDETCKQPHVYGASLTEGMFCAGSMDESVDACDGDSGGPLVCSENGAETLHGIISWGHHCGYANKPGVYVRIEKYIDWIYEKINFSLQQNGKIN